MNLLAALSVGTCLGVFLHHCLISTEKAPSLEQDLALALAVAEVFPTGQTLWWETYGRCDGSRKADMVDELARRIRRKSGGFRAL